MYILFFVLSVIFAPSQVFATDYWVSATGSNSNGCPSVDSVEVDPPTDPGVYKLTLANALACLAAGDRLIIKAGTYTDQQILNPISGASSSNRTVIMGDPSGARPVITYSGHPISSANTGIYCTVSTACTDVLIQHLEISNPYNGIKLSTPGVYNRFEVNDLYIHDTTDTCWLQSTSTSTIGGGHIVRNSHFAYCGKNYPTANGGAKYVPGMIALYGIGNNGLIERNEFEHNHHSVGIWYSGTTQSNVTIRYNSFHDNARFDIDTWMNQGGTSGSYRGPLMIEVAVPGGGHQIYNNIFYTNGCASCGAQQQNVTGVMAGVQADGTSTANIYNNTFYNFLNPTSLAVCTNGGANGWCATAPFTSKNNIAYLVSGGFTGTASNNLTTNPSFANAGAGNLTLAAGSPAIDAGVDVGLPFNGSAPDQGAFEVPTFASCSVEDGDEGRLHVTFNNNVFPPLLPSSGVTGFTVKLSGSNDVINGSSRVGTNLVYFALSDNVSFGNTISFSQAGGNLTDSALIGGTLNQSYVESLTNQSCVNNVGMGGGAAGLFTQALFRFHNLRGPEATPRVMPYPSAPNNTNIFLIPGGSVRLRFAILCTVADCPPTGFFPRYSRNGGAYTIIPDTFSSDKIGFCGNSDPTIPPSGSATSELLGGSGTYIAAAFVRTSNAIPTLTMPLNGISEMEYCLAWATTATPGDVYQFRVYQQDGTPLDVITVTPAATIMPTQAGVGF